MERKYRSQKANTWQATKIREYIQVTKTTPPGQYIEN